ncbi:MAG: GGDEF domain-containing protein [Paucibacter sp.]|nr:GGDEF domain-containing protein [Roseateles sp.]
MQFDNATLYHLLLVQAGAAALLLTALPGQRVSVATRWAQGFMGLQFLAWLAMGFASFGGERVLMGVALLLFAASLSCLWRCVGLWLAPRKGLVVMGLATLLMPAVYVLQFDQVAFRVGWAHAWLALQLVMIGLSVLRKGRESFTAESRRWRGLLLLATLPMAAIFVLRGGAGALGVELESPLAPSLINTVMGLACMMGLMCVLLALVLAWRGEIEADLAQLAQSDSLTGLADRASFMSRAVAMISMARRYDEPLSLMVLDIDHLTRLNAEQGREVGDRALALFASCLNAQMRLGDLAGRIGGDEFAVLMARTDAQGPQAFDQRMRQTLALRAQPALGVTLDFSAGWAPLRRGDRNVEDVLRRAETALYEAKHMGRGRLVAEPGLD